MEETASVTESAAVLSPGDMVVLYTDGVTEAHEGDAFFGETGIAEVLAASAGADRPGGRRRRRGGGARLPTRPGP